MSKNPKPKSVPKCSVGEGNTKLPPAPSLYWCFTWNNYNQKDIDLLKEKFVPLNIKYLFSEEIGKKCKTPHLQGFIQFPKKNRPSNLKLPKQIHWEKALGSLEQNLNYCTKDTGKCYTNISFPEKLEPVLSEKQLYPWQKYLINELEKKPDDRTIYWFWETEGNSGKTTLAIHLYDLFGAIPLEGKKNDILYCAAMFPSKIYIYDLERTMEDYVSYGAIEKIKNGFYMCAKYESKPIRRNKPHVVIFANFEPDYQSLSRDRWHVVYINEKKEAEHKKL
ncbi:Rep [uncultured virus]|uniref:Rep n=1 Tax=uncultured virus TaxID=340016 RepID=A0A2K9LSL9_9VIRU|nr:Rep [uncultured virus]